MTTTATAIAEKRQNLAAALRAADLTTEAVRSVLEKYGFFSIEFEGLTPYDMFDNLLRYGQNVQQNQWFTENYPYYQIYQILREVEI